MMFTWVICASVYFIINGIIAVSCVADSSYRKSKYKVWITLILLLFGLPIVVIVIIVALIVGIINAIKHKH